MSRRNSEPSAIADDNPPASELAGSGAHALLDARMAQLADGDREAFPHVFKALWPVLSRFCDSLLKHEQDAADAAQEAMAKIFERASQYDGRRPALAWALAIASWECRTTRRKRARRREVSAEHVDPAARDPHDAYDRSELTRAAITALEALSERDRETLLASFFEEAVPVSGPTLRKRRERAVHRLRSIWRRLYGFD